MSAQREETDDTDTIRLIVSIGVLVMLTLYILGNHLVTNDNKSRQNSPTAPPTAPPTASPTATSLPAPPQGCAHWDISALSSYAVRDSRLTFAFAEDAWNESNIKLSNNREMWIATPKGISPQGGWSVLWYAQPDGDYGMTQDMVANGSNLNEALRRAMIGVVNHEIAIVFIAPANTGTGENTWASYTDGYGYTCERGSNYCWNRGQNRDAPYLKESLAKARDPKYNLNLNSVVLMGYSSGAGMASLILEKQEEISFPQISALILIAGGSHFCYAYGSGSLPSQFVPCHDENKGCCPRNITEFRFDRPTPATMHPPTLLCQAKNDFYADVNASIFYFEKLKSDNQPAALITAEGSQHGLAPCQIESLITFVRYFSS